MTFVFNWRWLLGSRSRASEVVVRVWCFTGRLWRLRSANGSERWSTGMACSCWKFVTVEQIFVVSDFPSCLKRGDPLFCLGSASLASLKESWSPHSYLVNAFIFFSKAAVRAFWVHPVSIKIVLFHYWVLRSWKHTDYFLLPIFSCCWSSCFYWIAEALHGQRLEKL